MAIYKPSAGGVPRTSLPGVTLTIGGSGQPVMWTPTTNRMKPTPAFSQLDSLILALDASYDALANKAPWLTYAANIAGSWQLCANCEPGSSGKKLYRQYNFNRSLLGLSPVSAPISLSESSDIHFVNLAIVLFPPWAQYIIVSIDGQPTASLITAQVGAVLTNPGFVFPSFTADLNIPEGTSAFDQLFATRATGAPYFCQCTSEGAPGLKLLSTWTN